MPIHYGGIFGGGMSMLPFVILAVMFFLPTVALAIYIIIKSITKGVDVAMRDVAGTTQQKPLQPKWRRLIYGLTAFYILLCIIVTSWVTSTLLDFSVKESIYSGAIYLFLLAGTWGWLAYLTRRFTGTWLPPRSSTEAIIEWENKLSDNALKIFGYYMLGAVGLGICILLIIIFATL